MSAISTRLSVSPTYIQDVVAKTLRSFRAAGVSLPVRSLQALLVTAQALETDASFTLADIEQCDWRTRLKASKSIYGWHMPEIGPENFLIANVTAALTKKAQLSVQCFPEAALAAFIASAAHAFDLDKADDPYILHPLRMMLTAKRKKMSPRIQALCALHDAVEKGRISFADLAGMGFDTPFIRSLDALTKRPARS